MFSRMRRRLNAMKCLTQITLLLTAEGAPALANARIARHEMVKRDKEACRLLTAGLVW